MAITPEVKKQLDYDYKIREDYIKSAQKEANHLRDEPGHSFDYQVMLAFQVENTGDSISRYHSAYAGGFRDQYLKEFFDDMLDFHPNFSLADTKSVEKDLPDIYKTSQRFCNAPYLLKDNTDFFDRYYTEADRRKINVTHDYFHACTPKLDHVLKSNGYNTRLENKWSDPLPIRSWNADLMAQSAEFLYKQSMAAIEQKPFDTSFSFKVEPDSGKELFNLDKLLKANQLELYLPECRKAEEIFDNIFTTPLAGSCQERDMKAMGMDIFDMIYIDGISANEAFREKQEREGNAIDSYTFSEHMKAEVINAMVSGKCRLELATIQRDGDNKPKVIVNEIKPDLKAIEPPAKEDYSRIRRAFNFGPFKMKTRTEKIEHLLSSDRHKSKRQESIVKKLDSGIQILKDKDAEKTDQKIRTTNEKKEKAHNIMKEKPRLFYDDKLYFGKVDLPEKYEKDDYASYFSDNNQKFGKSVQTLSRILSRRSFVDFVMLTKGYTVDDLVNNKSEQFKKDLADSGKEAVDMLKEQDLSKLSEVFLETGKKLADVTYTAVNPKDPEAVAQSYDFSSRYSILCKDWEQLRSEPLKAKMMESDDQNINGRILSALNFNSLYHNQIKVIGEFYRSPDSCKPELEYDISLTAPASAQLALDNFQTFHKDQQINTWSMEESKVFERKVTLLTSIQGTTAFISEQNELAEKTKSAPAMTGYLRGAAPNPLRIDKQGNILRQDKVLKSANDVIKAEKEGEKRRAVKLLPPTEMAVKPKQAGKAPQGPKKEGMSRGR